MLTGNGRGWSCGIMECPELGGKHREHPLQPLALQTPQIPPRRVFQRLLELWQPCPFPVEPGQCQHPLGGEPLPNAPLAQLQPFPGSCPSICDSPPKAALFFSFPVASPWDALGLRAGALPCAVLLTKPLSDGELGLFCLSPCHFPARSSSVQGRALGQTHSHRCSFLLPGKDSQGRGLALRAASAGPWWPCPEG